jgi:diguanylate cyclase (GGDEF)-like protein
MQIPAKPANEAARIATLQSLNILDTPPEERFDRLTRLARRLFDVPVALVSLVDSDRQWFKSADGISSTETKRDISFCAHAIMQDDIFVVNNALADTRFNDNPLVTGDPRIRFYAGYPLVVQDGVKLGSLCLIDFKPRALGDADRQSLRDLGHVVEREIVAFKLATVDELTRVANRRGFEAVADYALKVCKRQGKPATLMFFDLNGFKQINDTHGHAAGDAALVTFARELEGVLRESDVVGRVGGDEFVVLSTHSRPAHAADIVARLRVALEATGRDEDRAYDIRFSVGLVAFNPDKHAGVADMLLAADQAMYLDKQAMARAAGISHSQDTQ